MWFTETPWPPILILAVGGVLCLIIWHAQRRGIWLIGLAGTLVLAAAVYFIEGAIVTPREEVEAAIMGITSAFEQGDRERTLGYISTRAEGIRQLAEKGIRMVDVEGLRVTDVRVRMRAESSRAWSHFRANATVAYRKRKLGRKPSRWEAVWQREGGHWRMIRVQRLNPVTGEPMGVWDWLRN